jgi:DNA polymerase-1
MQMLPGTHLTWVDYILVHVPLGAYEVIGGDGETYGHKWFWLQMLHGDGADFIPGLESFEDKNVGPVTAAEMLAGTTCNEEAFAVVASMYLSTYGDTWADRFVEQAALLWMRRTHAAPIHEFLEIVPADMDILRAIARMKRRVAQQEKRIAKINQE